ncbi:hypothetical protein OG264_10370 [Streptomyces xanthophaeus]|uniref:hypothetical protein n=1 Tax=Streptomyces xanthophaeus TaxID=67385 RepID=UPI0038690251|nr:hypothetical protein OG264_10370 [Streptomyces xanthophaeus]WST63147.1 hypothetical protein OG605_27990 [Streptomyces xanthophaeus]
MTDNIFSFTNLDSKEKRRASGWQHDPGMERLAEIRASHPEQYDAMGSVAHMSLGYYENRKSAAAATGMDVNNNETGK